MMPKFTASKEVCESKMEGEDTTMKQNFDMVKGTCCSDGLSACDGLDSGASSPSPASSNASSNATSTATGTVATVKQTSFAVTLPSIPAANFSGADVAAKAKADYIAQKAASGTTIDASKVTAVAETTVKTQVGFPAGVDATAAKGIMVKATGLPESDATVTEVTSRRLSATRRLTGKTFDVQLKVANSSAVADVAAATKDTAKIVEAAKEQIPSLTISEADLTVTEPTVDVKVSYVVEGAKDDVAPTTAEMAKVGESMGVPAEAIASIATTAPTEADVPVPTTTTAAAAEPDTETSSYSSR